MGGEGGDAERESERDGGWAGIVAKVAGVGGPRGAADERRAHDGNGERHRMTRRDQNLRHALGEEVGVRHVGGLQALRHLDQ